MNKKVALPVRFTSEQERVIGQIAEANGLSKSEVVRLAVTQFLAQLRENKELIVSQVVRSPDAPDSEHNS
jgi:hypothetical protein